MRRPSCIRDPSIPTKALIADEIHGHFALSELERSTTIRTSGKTQVPVHWPFEQTPPCWHGMRGLLDIPLAPTRYPISPSQTVAGWFDPASSPGDPPSLQPASATRNTQTPRIPLRVFLRRSEDLIPRS